MKKYYRILLLLVVMGFTMGCNEEEVYETRDLRVGMLISMGGVGDRAFNDSAIAGLNRAREEFGITTRYVDYRSPEKNLENLRIFAEEGFDLIIGIGFFNLQAIETVASEFPESHFAIIDVPSGEPNVYSAVFQEEEASFLAGVLAARQSITGKVGFLGGADIPVVNMIRRSYIAGVHHVNPDIEVISRMAGSFDDPELGHQIAMELYEQNCDVIYSGAGKTGVGAIGAAKSENRFFIGTDTDQCSLAPNNVLGSRMKNIDVVILDLVDQYSRGEFLPGTETYGIREGGLSILYNPSILGEETIAEMDQIEQAIIEGEIRPRDYISLVE